MSPKACALCGHTAADHREGFMGGAVYTADCVLHLCHVDEPCRDGMTCYHRWTLYGDRPEAWDQP